MTQSERNNWRWWRIGVLAELGIHPREGRPHALTHAQHGLVRAELSLLVRGIDKMARYLARVYRLSFSTIKRAWLENREAHHTRQCL